MADAPSHIFAHRMCSDQEAFDAFFQELRHAELLKIEATDPTDTGAREAAYLRNRLWSELQGHLQNLADERTEHLKARTE